MGYYRLNLLLEFSVLFLFFFNLNDYNVVWPTFSRPLINIGLEIMFFAEL